VVINDAGILRGIPFWATIIGLAARGLLHPRVDRVLPLGRPDTHTS